MSKTRPVALITGASAGIGLEFAHIFAREQYDVVLVARNEDNLNQLKDELIAAYKIEARVYCADLSHPSAAEGIANWLEKEQLTIEVLVNNAGYGVFGRFWETTTLEELGLLQVNIVSPASLIKLLLPGMVARKKGHIINVGSVAGFQPGPLMPLYYASKAFLLSFTEALANQLQGTGVSALLLAPGPTKTGFAKRTGGGEGEQGSMFIMSARVVAESGYKGMINGKTLVIPGVFNQLFVIVLRFIPRWLVTKSVRRGQEYMR